MTSFAFSVSLSKNKSSCMFVDEVSKMKINLLLPLEKPSYLSLLRTTRSSTRCMNCLLHFSFGARAQAETRGRQASKGAESHSPRAECWATTPHSTLMHLTFPSLPVSNELAPCFEGGAPTLETSYLCLPFQTFP